MSNPTLAAYDPGSRNGGGGAGPIEGDPRHDTASGSPWRRRFGNDRGAVASMIAVLGFAIFVSLALVVDGGRQLAALSEARDVADNAARFGSQEIDLDQWRATGRPIIDRSAADSRVAQYFANHVLAGGPTGRVVPSTGPDADITVTVEVTVRPTSFFFPARDAIVTESATALDGVTTP